jgi:hypothetical protein
MNISNLERQPPPPKNGTNLYHFKKFLSYKFTISNNNRN